MMTQERYLVTLPLTDEQIKKIEELFDKEAIATDHEAFVCVAQIVGTPVEENGLPVAGWAHCGHIGLPWLHILRWDQRRLEREAFFDTPLVCRTDAEAQIAIRDAKIAEKDREIAGYVSTVSAFITAIGAPDPMDAHPRPPRRSRPMPPPAICVAKSTDWLPSGTGSRRKRGRRVRRFVIACVEKKAESTGSGWRLIGAG